MKKVIVSGTVAMLLGLLVALPLSAQMAGGMRGDKLANQSGDIGLLILIDRMNLSVDQMQTLHDALASVVDQASGLKDLAASFRQDLINFQGNEDMLDALIQGYQTKLRDAMESIREQAQEALDSLKDSLTIRQGELLRAALMPKAPGTMMPGMMMDRQMESNSSPWGGPRFGEREGGRFGTNPWADRGEGFRAMRPQAGFAGSHPALERGEELLARASKIVQILELKLQALGS